ncbi:Unknown protein sequence [Pseudomonas viridiflava]|uniref:Uncharacterized protein n=1 Tax=Pseudomonas syringae pv. ribicola TaxID=55398 RepID=A0A0N8SNK5_PSESI|nr:Unknown protein sequence [Pseudomonas syringae pv. ribicola]KPZ23034.1 Unknown protein sequence [Pseudomonas viridiflava]
MIDAVQPPVGGEFDLDNGVPVFVARQVNDLRREGLAGACGHKNLHPGRQQRRVTLLHDHAQSPAFQTHQRTHRVDAHGLDESLEHHVIEVAFPGSHLTDRMGNTPAFLVRPVRGDRVIHVADRTHSGEDADVRPLQSIGVARAVDLLMVMQADIHHQRRDRQILLENFQPLLGMGLHQAEFFDGQPAGFVEDFRCNHHLADVMHESRHASLTDLLILHAHPAGKRYHQRADGNRMHVGVFIRCLEAGQADQGVRMAQDRVGNFLDHQVHIVHLHGVPHPGLAEHVHHDIAGLAANGSGALDLLFQAGRCGVVMRRGRCGLRRVITALLRVDPDLERIGRLNAFEHVDIVKNGFDVSDPERITVPGATELVDVHAKAEFGDGDLFQHAQPPRSGSMEQPVREQGATAPLDCVVWRWIDMTSPY